MTLELAERDQFLNQWEFARDISVKVVYFTFPADFVVVDFEPDPRVPLILGRCFLKTSRALIDVHKGELTLRIGSEAITYNLDQTSRYSANYTHMTANKIDVIDMACEEYSQEVLVNHHTPLPKSSTIYAWSRKDHKTSCEAKPLNPTVHEPPRDGQGEICSEWVHPPPSIELQVIDTKGAENLAVPIISPDWETPYETVNYPKEDRK
ncbi:reverse transcriptase domain-containing protein [Tanacetum coccineum]